MNVKSTSFEKFLDELNKDILEKLEGSHDSFKRFQTSQKPSKNIVIGTLGDKSKDYSPTVEDEERTLTTVKNNSMTLKFLIENSGVIDTYISVSLFYRVYPTHEEQKEYNEKRDEEGLAKIYKRRDVKIGPINLDLSKDYDEKKIDFDDAIESIKSDPEVYRGKGDFKEYNLGNKDEFEKCISNITSKSIPNFDWEAKLVFKKEKFSQNNQTYPLINISLINETQEDYNYETFLFNSEIDINLNDVEIVEFQHDYQYEGFPYSYSKPLRCLNCHADYERNSNSISTKNFSIFDQKKLIPRNKIRDLRFEFEQLIDEDQNIKKLNEFKDILNEYLAEYKKDNRYSNDEKYSYDVGSLEKLKERFEEGIDLLKQNDKAKQAFILMNETFRNAVGYDSWRVFQIFFIVSLIPDIIDKDKRRNICDILHVDTGGGKSEAYFGAVIFSAFWDRLNGKRFGTTALTKFPLRMLSVQQLQRIANLLIWAEEQRKKEKLGGHPFSIAYFVGTSEDFPRHTHEIIEKIDEAKNEGTELEGKIIETCPICDGDVILSYDEKRKILHKCSNCGREYRLFYTDEEIYRYVPTFIVSTVDKFAGISLNRRLKNVFGGKIDKCPEGHGFIPRNDKCEVQTEDDKCGAKGEPVEKDFETAPTLEIQDEMHLIRESFGTINSHFETLLDEIQKRFSGYGLKNIAMTATLTGAEDQVKHLYHKDIQVFPGDSPGDRGKKDIFFEYEKNKEGEPVTQRKLIGLKPNMRDNQFSSLLTIKYMLQFIKYVESNKEEFIDRTDIPKKELDEIIKYYKYVLTYHNKKSDVHSINYYLNAVVNSKIEDYKIKPNVLTGDSSLDDIKKLITDIEKFHNNILNKNKINSVFATSIVSHGVDISKWNFMVFQGMPRNTAEYIQALSRVGRKYPASVFVWFYPNRVRDLSFYQNFERYHQILPHKVEPVPISRWAKLGLHQTLTSVFNASILNYYSNIIEKPLYSVDEVKDIFSKEKHRKNLIDFIQSVYITDSSMKGSSDFKKIIPNEVEDRLTYLHNYNGGETNFFPNALKDCGNKYYKTQYGMRGIQDEAKFKFRDPDKDKLEKWGE